MSGHVFRLARAGAPGAPPAGGPSLPCLLSQTGAFADTRTLRPAPGLIPYDVNCPLFSDNAVKTRWVALPYRGGSAGPGERVRYASTGEWSFPAGTVFVKHFEVALDETRPDVRRRLETRLLVRDPGGSVYGFTYRWKPDGGDAELLEAGLSEQITVKTTAGPRTQTWYYPGPADCMTCHNANAGYVLGVKTRQLNGDCRYPATGVTDNQLRVWNHLGLFDTPLKEADIPKCARLVAVTDTRAPLEERVRSYLDANCAHCHRPNGAHALFDARYDTPPADQNIVDGPVLADLGVEKARVIAARDDGRSLLYVRMKSCEGIRMPPVARNLPDAAAVAVVHDWLNQLPRKAPRPKLAWHLGLLAGGFKAALLLGALLRRLLVARRRVGLAWLASLAPTLAVPLAGLAKALLLRAHGGSWLPVAGASLGAALLALLLFGRRPRAVAKAGDARPASAQNRAA
jgi:uncharacterized repeat protein (TIGR03806 family)